MSLEQLLQDVRDDKQGALERAMAALQSPLRRYFITFEVAPADAADLIQKTLEVVMRRLPNHPPRPSWKAWVFRVAHNQAIDHYRGQQRQMRLAVNNAERLALSPGTSPPSKLHELQRRAELDAAIASLTTPDRALIEAILEGVNLSELARRMGVSPEALRARKARLLRKLRPILSKTTTTPDLR